MSESVTLDGAAAVDAVDAVEAAPPPRKRRSLLSKVLGNWSVRLGGGFLCLLVLMALAAPVLGTIDPTEMDPASGNLLPGTRGEFNSLSGDSFEHLFVMGTDSLGRDIWSRVVFGARVSLVVGVAVAVFTLVFGLTIGLVAGYFRRLDGIIMRLMDGVMAIPGILFAVSLVAMFGGTMVTVIFAIAVPEIPRVARLVRSVVLSVREEPYVEAAIALDTPTWKIMFRHILPNAVAPLVIQATYVCAAAILVEAILSFLGVGLPAETATWGNIMAEGRAQFNQYPHNVLFPGALLALTVLSINILGDGLRDALDPKFNKRGE
jgi:peptide/nickel transport system permease protein